jgi:hypothetical protein
MKLLNVDANAKTIKGQKKGYLTGVLYLAPYDVSGINVCAMSELAGCRKTCLFVQGRAGISAGSKMFTAPNGRVYNDNVIIRCRIRRTELFHNDRQAFLTQMEKEIHALIRKGNRINLIPTVRLNGTSDIRWENIKFENGDTLFTRFPEIQFYDYTKLNNRKNIPSNYHLSWSYSEATKRYATTMPKDINPVVVFAGGLPDTFLGKKVIDGDENDLRFLDGKGIVVGLKAKGSARKDTSGFVVHLQKVA